MNQHFDCIVIGAGISGLTAAIYLKRANYNILVIESSMIGGQINKTSKIENYPGFTSVDGPTFVENLQKQVSSLQLPIIYEEVINLKKEADFEIITKNNKYKTTGVIIATGRKPNKLNIENEDKLIGRGISYCALCDGMFFKDKDVCIVGGGNSAFEESLYLANICRNVTIINRSDKLKASQILIDKAKAKNNIEILYNSSVSKINEKDDKLESIIVNNKEIKCSGLFIYIGLNPDIEYLNNLDIAVVDKYIVVDSNMRTNIDNLYACGDVIKKEAYQIITAASEGAKAAISFGKDFKGVK